MSIRATRPSSTGAYQQISLTGTLESAREAAGEMTFTLHTPLLVACPSHTATVTWRASRP